MSRVVAVDNGSTDGTRDWLQEQGLGRVILNRANYGCGVAWNQGVQALQSDWTVVMNNDVVCGHGWLEGLIDAASQRQLSVACPSMIEGPLDYDFGAFVKEHADSTRQMVRPGSHHGVCMLIHDRVWTASGFFHSIPRLLGFEDRLFFELCRHHGFEHAVVGGSWIHHFGSVTQKAMATQAPRRELGDRDLMRRLELSNWIARKIHRRALRRNESANRQAELATAGVSLHGVREDGRFRWL